MSAACTKTLLAIIVMAGFPTAVTLGDEAGDLHKPPKGSMARQLLLKVRLQQKFSEGSLAAAMDHNRKQWEALPAEQRDQYRQAALAFLNKSPEEQQRLVKHYEQLISLSAEKRTAYRRRATWLKVVVASMTPAERQELRKLPPDERAKKLLARKAELIKAGRLKEDDSDDLPATQSAEPVATTQPASQPAGE